MTFKKHTTYFGLIIVGHTVSTLTMEKHYLQTDETFEELTDFASFFQANEVL